MIEFGPEFDAACPWLGRARRGMTGRRGGGVIVAVSGGSDSVGLLLALGRLAGDLDVRPTVAHLDHGAREGSAAEAEGVARLAAALGLPVEVGRWVPTRPAHFEADARKARLAWLADVASRWGAAAVAVGHTRDDQAETVLHRVIRGTGPRGLAGMRRSRPLAPGVDLIRPLLDVRRAEIRASLVRLSVPWTDDPTNLDTARTRARLRHDLISKLEADYNPRVVDALARLAHLSAAREEALDRRVGALVAKMRVDASDSGCTLDRRALARLSRALRAEVLRHVWRREGWPERGMGERRWRRLAVWAGRAGMSASVGAGVHLRTTEERLILSRRVEVLSPPCFLSDEVAAPIPGLAAWGGGVVEIATDPAGACDERVDLDRLVMPLTVRGPRDGDRFAPLGMEGMQPLNDFFRGRRVAREARRAVPLLCDAEGIVWVVGHRIAGRVRTTEATVRVAGLSWRGPGCG